MHMLLWILALLTEPLLLIFATPLLLTTLGFSTSRCRPSGRTMISLLPP